MLYRPLVLVGALTAGDFVLWNWSLSASDDVLALIAGLTLLPLAAATVLLLALAAVQAASRITRSSSVSAAFRRAAAIQRPHLNPARPAHHPDLALNGGNGHARAVQGHDQLDEGALAAASARAPSPRPPRKLAA